ncbi:MAG: hypothetical protein IPN80_01715 [Flavobacterium sp.]|nr:hypothetical protein [Flavobacterium sp.]
MDGEYVNKLIPVPIVNPAAPYSTCHVLSVPSNDQLTVAIEVSVIDLRAVTSVGLVQADDIEPGETGPYPITVKYYLYI